MEIRDKEEIWRGVVGYENILQVSNKGRVKRLGFSLPRMGKLKYYEERLLKQGTTSQGYKTISLKRRSHGEKQKGFMVHTLVLRAFKGECPKGMEARHLNDIPDDNQINNLEWGTHSQNELDKKLNRYGPKKVTKPFNLVQEADMFLIWGFFLKGYPVAEIARKMGVSRATVRSILGSKTNNSLKFSKTRNLPLLNTGVWASK